VKDTFNTKLVKSADLEEDNWSSQQIWKKTGQVSRFGRKLVKSADLEENWSSQQIWKKITNSPLQ
jgi:hypothetical protein